MVKRPSSPVTTSTVATASPTRRSAWTTAPGTGPSGPATAPCSVALPGPIATVVVVRPGTPARLMPLVSTCAVVVVTATFGAGGRGGTVLDWHAAPTTSATAATTSRTRDLTRPSVGGAA